ncbi:electron transfer flavoprotein subunit alpha/FixB family protein, partial [Aeromicrobium fastidiosum]
MTEVLVLIDAPDGKVTKPSLELLTIARRIGEPSAVVFADASGHSADNGVLAEYGAEKIYTYDDAVYDEYLVGPKAEALSQLVAEVSPAAVLTGSSTEAKEISARVALKTESGWIGDAVDVQADGGTVTTTQSVFAGN